eukprot:PhM_4_TR13669/c0_g1_i1/m.70877
MDRVGAKWRRLHNQADVITALRRQLPKCSAVFVQTFSKKTTLAQQISAVHNATVVLTGRGAASALFPFLPHGGIYVSFSSDGWNPYRDIEPAWTRVVHRYVKPTHHDRGDRPPVKFPYGIDTNRCGYVEDDVDGFAEVVVKAIVNERKKRYPTSTTGV